MVREKIILKPRKEQEVVCPFCRDDVNIDEPSHSCVGCLTKFHDDCFKDELKSKCSTLGCSGKPTKVTTRVPRDPDYRPSVVYHSADSYYREREQRAARIRAKYKRLNAIYDGAITIILGSLSVLAAIGVFWLLNALIY